MKKSIAGILITAGKKSDVDRKEERNRTRDSYNQ
jgi:hypothetical protein